MIIDEAEKAVRRGVLNEILAAVRAEGAKVVEKVKGPARINRIATFINVSRAGDPYPYKNAALVIRLPQLRLTFRQNQKGFNYPRIAQRLVAFCASEKTRLDDAERRHKIRTDNEKKIRKIPKLEGCWVFPENAVDQVSLKTNLSGITIAQATKIVEALKKALK